MKAGGRSGNVKARDIAAQRGHLDIVDLLSRWERKKADPINDAFREVRSGERSEPFDEGDIVLSYWGRYSLNTTHFV